jgi:hypothetical protein
MSVVCSFIFLIAGIVFAVGYAIGYSAFKTSPKRKAYAIISGVTAIVVTFGILFAGCMLLLKDLNVH